MKEVQLRVRITAETAANIAKAARAQDVPISHLVRQALQVQYGGADNGRGPGVQTRRASSSKVGVNPAPADAGTSPAPVVGGSGRPPATHEHVWGPRSTVTALKRCKTCPAVKA